MSGAAASDARPPRAVAAVAAATRLWALLGGAAAFGLAAMTAASALSNLFLGRPFAADHELTKHLVAVVVFTFLPYCQIAGANVSVDIFTERAGARAKALMAAAASVVALAFALLLLRQMSLGLESYLRFVERTPVLGLPLWTAFPPILLSLGLLLLAALVTLIDALRVLAGRLPWDLAARPAPARPREAAAE